MVNQKRALDYLKLLRPSEWVDRKTELATFYFNKNIQIYWLQV